MTEEETEKAQATRDAALWASVTLLVAHCGGDINKATEAQKADFAADLAAWIITSGDNE